MSWWHWIIVHLSQETGTSNASSRAYDFWSGFGSDIGEVTLVGVVLSTLRRYNCGIQGCWRIGHRGVGTTGHVVCRRHHPDPAPTYEQVLSEHRGET